MTVEMCVFLLLFILSLTFIFLWKKSINYDFSTRFCLKCSLKRFFSFLFVKRTQILLLLAFNNLIIILKFMCMKIDNLSLKIHTHRENEPTLNVGSK